MTEKGVVKTWAPGQEEFFNKLLSNGLTFAQAYMTTMMRFILKYDFRTKEAKRALAKLRLQLMTATDDDLVELAMLQSKLQPDGLLTTTVEESLEKLKEDRDRLRTRGIKKAELEIRPIV